MRISTYIRNRDLETAPRVVQLMDDLREKGFAVESEISEQTDMILALGGDGTFLSAAKLAADSGVPVLGVNFGRLGFLSENNPEGLAQSLLNGDYTIEDRALLSLQTSEKTAENQIDEWPYALNEISVHRAGAAMLGVDVTIDGAKLPTYWADGLLVATSSGSTAYSLSVGGPIVMPEAKVLIIAPIASHNLNVRPIVVPLTSKIDLALRSRDEKVMLTVDNRTAIVDKNMALTITQAPFSLKKARLNASNFIAALTSKLFWGEDIRNFK